MFVAVDIGGTNIRIVAAKGLDEPVFLRKPVRHVNSPDYESNIDFIVTQAKELSGGTIKAVGIGINGTVGENKQYLLSSQNSGHWAGKPIVEEVSRHLGCPVFFDNDANNAALGEAYWGDIRGDFAYVVWGTGVGGVLVEHETASKPAVHNINSGDGWGRYFRAWEMSCGGRKLAEQYQKAPEDLSADEWHDVLSTFTRHAKSFVEQLQPKAVVFAGGLSQRHKNDIEALSDTLGVPCRISAFGDESGLVGSLALIRHYQEQT